MENNSEIQPIEKKDPTQPNEENVQNESQNEKPQEENVEQNPEEKENSKENNAQPEQDEKKKEEPQEEERPPPAEGEDVVWVEFCTSCKSHSWCTRHDEKKYLWFFTELRNRIEGETGIRVEKAPGKPQLGAFEVKFNDTPLFSKIQTLQWPYFSEIMESLQAARDAPKEEGEENQNENEKEEAKDVQNKEEKEEEPIQEENKEGTS